MAFLLSQKKEQLSKKGKGFTSDYTVTSEFVKSHLMTYTREAKGKSWLIPCPFHSEVKPSLSVVVDANHRLPVGSWKCFGCNKSGHWNILAKALNLPIKTNKRDFSSNEDQKSFIIKDSGDDYFSAELSVEYSQKLNTASPWPKNKPWRGFSGAMVNRNKGAHVSLDIHYPLWFQAYQKAGVHTLVGVIRCLPKKINGSPMKSYLFSDNSWLSSYLWPENEIQATDYVILVEGVRDALALQHRGIPALAVLGVTAGITEARFMTLMSLGVTEVITFMDGDKAGKEGSKRIKTDIGMEMFVREFKTWKLFPSKDPFELLKSLEFVSKFERWVHNGRRL